MADVVDLTGEPEVIDLTDEPEAKRQDLSNAPLGDDLLDLVYKQLPLREKMRAARVNKGFNRVAKNNMLGEAEGKLKHIVHYYQKRIARPHVNESRAMHFAGYNIPYAFWTLSIFVVNGRYDGDAHEASELAPTLGVSCPCMDGTR